MPYLTTMVERGVAQQIRPSIAIIDDVTTGASLNAITVFLHFVVKPWSIAKFEEKFAKAAANKKFAEYFSKCFTGELPGRGKDVVVEQKFGSDTFLLAIMKMYHTSFISFVSFIPFQCR